MKISDNIPGRARSFDDILEEIKSSKELFHRILKTIYGYGYLTDGVILSKFIYISESVIIEKLHYASMIGSDDYSKIRMLDVIESLPIYLGPEVETADYAGQGQRHSMVLLRGSGRESLVETRGFLTLVKRHPNAQWRFSKGRNYFHKPVVLIEGEGFRKGVLLGAITPMKIEGWVRNPHPPSEECYKLVDDTTLRYEQTWQ